MNFLRWLAEITFQPSQPYPLWDVGVPAGAMAEVLAGVLAGLMVVVEAAEEVEVLALPEKPIPFVVE